MTKEEALKQTKERFTNLLEGDILPGVTVGEIISYYESLIAGDKPVITDEDCNITKSFLEEEIQDDEFYLRNGYTRH